MIFHKLRPFVVSKPWGGANLEKMKKLSLGDGNNEPIGETWEVSVLEEGPSVLKDGKTLSSVLEKKIPYLIKFIDTSDYLSIQVHPDDEYAKINENSSGKTECWFILDAKPGSGIYLGMKDEMSKDEFAKMIHENGDLTKVITFHEVSRGDFFYVPAGSIHAIGKGVTLIEVQQSSGITYRVWDWNRVDENGNSRDLHVRQALDVLNFSKDFNCGETFKIKKDTLGKKGITRVVEHRDFKVRVLNISESEEVHLDVLNENKMISLISLEGEVSLGEKPDLFSLDTYESCLIDKSDKVMVTSKKGATLLIVD